MTRDKRQYNYHLFTYGKRMIDNNMLLLGKLTLRTLIANDPKLCMRGTMRIKSMWKSRGDVQCVNASILLHLATHFATHFRSLIVVKALL